MTDPSRPLVVRALGWAFVAMCWGVLLAVVVPFAIDVWRYRHVDGAAIVAELPVALARDPGPQLPVTLTEAPPPGVPEVLVFGESTVALDPRQLERALTDALAPLGVRVHVSNYGTSGWTSGPIARRVDAVLDAYDAAGRRPALVLIYSGHNDYTHGFFSYVTRDLRFSNTVVWLWRLPFRARAYWEAEEGYQWFERGAAASLGRLTQQLGLTTLGDDPFPGAKARMAEAWQHKAHAMITRAHESGAVIGFYTPVGNLVREPFGPLGATTGSWKAGLAASDYGERIKLLVAARDAEVVTPDLRADTQLQQRVRALAAGDEVIVIDLQRDWEDRQLAFDETQFVDYLHLSRAGFVELARSTADELARHEPLLARLRPAP